MSIRTHSHHPRRSRQPFYAVSPFCHMPRLDRRRHAETRSGKIMRRVIAGISNFADVGDTTTPEAACPLEVISGELDQPKHERRLEPLSVHNSIILQIQHIRARD